MSEPGALGIYQQSNRVPPAHVSDRPWLGVNWGGDGRPEGFGQSLLAGLIGSRGDLQQFARDWIPADAIFLHQVSEPWINSDWRDPLIGWTQGVQSAARVAAPAVDSAHRAQLAAAAIAGVCQARSLTPRQLTDGVGELLEEFLLQEAWQPPANDDELPEEWPALWNPVRIGGSRGQPDVDGRIQFSNLSLSFPRPSAEAWPRLVFFRADGARAISRLSPFKLAQQGPRTWGNAKAVLSELFGAIGSVVEGHPVQVDARGVLLCKFGEEWRPLTNRWSYWLHLFEWMESMGAVDTLAGASR